MIKVNYVKKDNKISKLTVTGHANYAESGKDIVCSSISAIMNGVNALKNDSSFKITINDGFVEIIAISEVCENDEIVLETMIKQIEAVAEQYSKYVKIN